MVKSYPFVLVVFFKHFFGHLGASIGEKHDDSVTHCTLSIGSFSIKLNRRKQRNVDIGSGIVVLYMENKINESRKYEGYSI